MILNGDCLSHLKHLEINSIDSLVTDPPAGISFMGKAWDDDKGGRKQWIAWMTEVMQECLRVLKPGAHGLVWALPRTSHWTATALEDAGFEVRDVVTHIFGSGFPKSLNISKAIDKAAGAEREVLGLKSDTDKRYQSNVKGFRAGNYNNIDDPEYDLRRQDEFNKITAPSTDAAKQWDGWGTALKPASEHWILVRKPISEKTVAANVLKHGVGALNIDASRIGSAADLDAKDYDDSKRTSPKFSGILNGGKDWQFRNHTGVVPNGRFPANLVLSHSEHCTDEQCDIECAVKGLDEQSGILKNGGNTQFPGRGSFPIETKQRAYYKEHGGASRFFKCFNSRIKNDNQLEWRDQKNSKNAKHVIQNLDLEELRLSIVREAAEAKSLASKNAGLQACQDYIGSFKSSILRKNLVSLVEIRGSIDTIETIPNLLKLFGCALLAIEKSIKQENQKNDNDQERATNFLYCAKASRSDKGASNTHPTVKSTKLMQYLIRMITPPKGIVLDPFTGSGSTGVAAVKEGFDFIGIEQNEEYSSIAKARVNEAHQYD